MGSLGVNQRFQPQGACHINATFDGNLIRARQSNVKDSLYQSTVHDNAIEEYALVFQEAIDGGRHADSIRLGHGSFAPSVFTDWSYRAEDANAPVCVGVAANYAESGVGRKQASVALQVAGTVTLNNFSPNTFVVGDLVYWDYPDVKGDPGRVRNAVVLPRRSQEVIRAQLVPHSVLEKQLPLKDIESRLVGKCLSMSGPGDAVHVLLM